jgi:hypothetical protein
VTEPARLYSAVDIAKILGVSRAWVHNRLRKNGSTAPPPAFMAQIAGKNATLLWAENDLRRWSAYHASVESAPARGGKYSTYSDHRAVNYVRDVPVTWKLWWRCMPEGRVMWWFSTPAGWWTSENDGVSWVLTELDVRPTDFHYYSVNGNACPSGAVAAVLRTTTELRHRLEKGAA